MRCPETQFCPIDFELAYVMSEPAVFKPQPEKRQWGREDGTHVETMLLFNEQNKTYVLGRKDP